MKCVQCNKCDNIIFINDSNIKTVDEVKTTVDEVKTVTNQTKRVPSNYETEEERKRRRKADENEKRRLAAFKGGDRHFI